MGAELQNRCVAFSPSFYSLSRYETIVCCK